MLLTETNRVVKDLVFVKEYSSSIHPPQLSFDKKVLTEIEAYERGTTNLQQFDHVTSGIQLKI